MIKLEQNKNLQNYNTMNVAVHAATFVEINEQSQLSEISFDDLKKFYVLGGGSNVLFRKDYAGTILKINLKGIEEKYINEEEVAVKIAAGENWHQFVLFTLSKNYGGLENLSLIPGTVGASPIQNIGAYGVEVKDFITHVEGFHVDEKKIISFTNHECQFGYRDSIFKRALRGKVIITNVVFKLKRKNHKLHLDYGAIQNVLKENACEKPSIQDISKAVIAIREQKLPNPSIEPNTGSFFKNPIVSEKKILELKENNSEMPNYPAEGGVKIPAGWLIEQTGWKGKKENGVGVHPRQALVIVNYENKSGKAVFDFSEKIINDVKHKFGITLEREVNLVN